MEENTECVRVALAAHVHQLIITQIVDVIHDTVLHFGLYLFILRKWEKVTEKIICHAITDGIDRYFFGLSVAWGFCMAHIWHTEESE